MEKHRQIPSREFFSFFNGKQIKHAVENIIRERRYGGPSGLEEDNPVLFEFILEMKNLREATNSFPYLTDAKNYSLGNSIMEQNIREHYERLGQEIPKLSEEDIETYFYDLTGAEDTHYESGVLSQKNILFVHKKKPLTRKGLLKHILSPYGYSNNEKLQSMVKIQRNIQEKSDEYGREMLLEKSGIFDNLRERFSSSNFDPEEGIDPPLIYGAVDIYMPFKIHEELEQIRRMREL